MATPSKPADDSRIDPLQLLADVIRDQQAFFKDVLATVADISKYAIQPPASDAQQTGAAADRGPGSELDLDIDPSDPMEAFLGPDFQREVSGLYDADSETPFGLPGIKDESPDPLARPGA